MAFVDDQAFPADLEEGRDVFDCTFAVRDARAREFGTFADFPVVCFVNVRFTVFVAESCVLELLAWY